MVVNLVEEDVCTKAKNQRKTLRKSSKNTIKRQSTENQKNTVYRSISKVGPLF